MIDNNLEVKQWKIDDLIGAEYNPRKLSPEQKKNYKRQYYQIWIG